jgi:hypothetical protein
LAQSCANSARIALSIAPNDGIGCAGFSIDLNASRAITRAAR